MFNLRAMPLYWNIVYSYRYGRKIQTFGNSKTAISPQPLNGFYETRTKLYLEAFSIVCGKRNGEKNLKFCCNMPSIILKIMPA